MSKVIPGPGLFESLRLIPQFQKNLIPPMEHLFKKYGDYSQMSLLNHTTIFAFHPDGVQHVLKTTTKNFVKGDDVLELRVLLGLGMLSSDGEQWLAHRRVIAPEFQKKKIETLYPAICKSVEMTVEEWQGEKMPFDIGISLAKLTYAVAGECFFGTNLLDSASVVREAIEAASKPAIERMTSLFPIPLWAPLPSYRRARAAIKDLNAIVYEIIDKRVLNAGFVGEDILTRMTRIKKETGQSTFTREEMRDEVMTLLLAGHESTTSALTWTLHLLSEHEKIQADVQDELARFVAGPVPTLSELPKLELLMRVFQESMRLFPPAPNMSRKSVGAQEVGGFELKAETNVELSAWITHRHPDFWANPLEFNPRRFESDQEKKQHPFAYFPFGGGPRECVGQNFAMLEALTILAALIKNFKLRSAAQGTITPVAMFSIRPEPGVFLKATAV